MVSGLLMELDDHNCQPVAEAVGHRGPHRLGLKPWIRGEPVHFIRVNPIRIEGQRVRYA
jgi:hypothetical protein